MPRDRHPRRGSPSSPPGNYSPESLSPARSYSRSGSRLQRRGSVYESPARSRSQSHRRGRRDSSASSGSSARSSASRGHGKAHLASKLKDKTTTTSGLKSSLVFLGSVAAATYVAHKFWPKGITYGDREAWEEEEHNIIKKAKHTLRSHKPPHHDHGPSRHAPPEGMRADHDSDRRHIAYDRPRSSLARYKTDDSAARRGRDDRLAVEGARRLRRAASLLQGHHLDGVATVTVASGSRGDGAARRDDARFLAPRDRRGDVFDEGARYADYARPMPRYVERELLPRRRSSFDGLPNARRGERVVYMEPHAGYR